MALSDPVKAEAAAIIGSNEPVNLKMVLLNQLWLKHGLASHQVVPPGKLLVHPSNRGGAMLNGHDVLAKGARRSDRISWKGLQWPLACLARWPKGKSKLKPTRCWWSNFLRFWHLSKEMNCTWQLELHTAPVFWRQKPCVEFPMNLWKAFWRMAGNGWTCLNAWKKISPQCPCCTLLHWTAATVHKWLPLSWNAWPPSLNIYPVGKDLGSCCCPDCHGRASMQRLFGWNSTFC